MNSFEKYEIFREMPQETFDAFKSFYYSGHTNVFEAVATVVKYGIAGLLAYIAYDQYGVDTLISVLSGISAACIVFRKKLIGMIPSIISSIKMTKKVLSGPDGANDVLCKFDAVKTGLADNIIRAANTLNQNNETNE